MSAKIGMLLRRVEKNEEDRYSYTLIELRMSPIVPSANISPFDLRAKSQSQDVNCCIISMTNGSFCCRIILNPCLLIRLIIITHQLDILTLQKAFEVIARYIIIRLAFDLNRSFLYSSIEKERMSSVNFLRADESINLSTNLPDMQSWLTRAMTRHLNFLGVHEFRLLKKKLQEFC